MITFRQKGDFSKLNHYFEKLKEGIKIGDLDKYGRAGVEALSNATPKDTGQTASSWYYEIKRSNGSVSIQFKNSNVHEGVPIAVILQYGHGTGNGGWIQGKDYINPAIRPLFNEILEDLRKEVKKL